MQEKTGVSFGFHGKNSSHTHIYICMYVYYNFSNKLYSFIVFSLLHLVGKVKGFFVFVRMDNSDDIDQQDDRQQSLDTSTWHYYNDKQKHWNDQEKKCWHGNKIKKQSYDYKQELILIYTKKGLFNSLTIYIHSVKTYHKSIRKYK